MADPGAPPIIPTELQQYNSYVQDPKWQIKFTIVWTLVLGCFVLVAIPGLLKRIKNGNAFAGAVGMTEDARAYERVMENIDLQVEERPVFNSRKRALFVEKIINVLGSVLYWTPPWVNLNAGQVFIVCAYLAVTITCIICQVPLINNPNRAGFLAIAQLPPVFLFATKNSVVSFLLGLGFGYERLNFIHRWAGRGLFLSGLVHGSLWIRNHLSYRMPILGQQKETSGIACFSLLCIIVLTSLRPVRRYMWNAFWIIHFLCYVAFFITVCNHTLYARPWIYPPLAFYGLDLLMRMIKIRIQDATLVPVDKQMTLVHIPYITSGWTAGQHVRLRVFFRGRLFESHPFTIMCAPPTEGCLARPLPSMSKKSKDLEEDMDLFPDAEGVGYAGSGIVLGVRAAGDWTRALNSFAFSEGKRLRAGEDQYIAGTETVPVPVYTMIDGPYGGCSIDPSAYERVLFVSGGSGATFTIGLLDELVGKCLKTEQAVTRKIEFVWYIRSFATTRWFASFLNAIAHHAATCPELDLHITVYVTCLCDPEKLPRIPNCDVLLARPEVTEVVRRVAEGSSDPATKAEDGDLVFGGPSETDKKSCAETSTEDGITDDWGPVGGGGFAVCASGPQSLTREVANAVAALSASRRGRELGRIGLHTEVFAL